MIILQRSRGYRKKKVKVLSKKKKKRKYRDRAADVIHIAEVEEFFEVPVEGQERKEKPRVGCLVKP